jgi:DNA-binding transcriptional ArsR family regulator
MVAAVDEAADLAKTVGDPGRTRIVRALKNHELCVCQIVELLGLAPSTVSRHLSLLRRAGLVTLRKQGRWAYYRRPGREARPAVRGLFRWLDAAVSGADAEDAKRLEEILAVPLEELCRTD